MIIIPSKLLKNAERQAKWKEYIGIISSFDYSMSLLRLKVQQEDKIISQFEWKVNDIIRVQILNYLNIETSKSMWFIDKDQAVQQNANPLINRQGNQYIQLADDEIQHSIDSAITERSKSNKKVLDLVIIDEFNNVKDVSSNKNKRIRNLDLLNHLLHFLKDENYHFDISNCSIDDDCMKISVLHNQYEQLSENFHEKVSPGFLIINDSTGFHGLKISGFVGILLDLCVAPSIESEYIRKKSNEDMEDILIKMELVINEMKVESINMIKVFRKAIEKRANINSIDMVYKILNRHTKIPKLHYETIVQRLIKKYGVENGQLLESINYWNIYYAILMFYTHSYPNWDEFMIIRQQEYASSAYQMLYL